MSYGEVIRWLADGTKNFKQQNIDNYRQALNEFDKNPDVFDALAHYNAEELRKKL